MGSRKLGFGNGVSILSSEIAVKPRGGDIHFIYGTAVPGSIEIAEGKYLLTCSIEDLMNQMVNYIVENITTKSALEEYLDAVGSVIARTRGR